MSLPLLTLTQMCSSRFYGSVSSSAYDHVVKSNCSGDAMQYRTDLHLTVSFRNNFCVLLVAHGEDLSFQQLAESNRAERSKETTTETGLPKMQYTFSFNLKLFPGRRVDFTQNNCSTALSTSFDGSSVEYHSTNFCNTLKTREKSEKEAKQLLPELVCKRSLSPSAPRMGILLQNPYYKTLSQLTSGKHN